MKFEVSEFENLVSERYRWKQHWEIIEFLYLRQSSDKKQKSHMKKFLNPLLILNKKSIRFLKDEAYSYSDNSSLSEKLNSSQN